MTTATTAFFGKAGGEAVLRGVAAGEEVMDICAGAILGCPVLPPGSPI